MFIKMTRIDEHDHTFRSEELVNVWHVVRVSSEVVYRYEDGETVKHDVARLHAGKHSMLVNETVESLTAKIIGASTPDLRCLTVKAGRSKS